MRQFFIKIAEKFQKTFNAVAVHTAAAGESIFNLRHTDAGLILSSVIIGIVVGAAIVLFHTVMIGFENVFSFLFDETVSVPVIRFFALPLLAGLGGLGVGILNTTIFKESYGHGFESVVEAIRKKGGRLRGRLALQTMLNAAISISSGGGGGREAPTILLGSALGSRIGQAVDLKAYQLRLLSAAGASAAMAGIFNAPLGGVVFAIEVILGKLTLVSVMPVVLSAVMSTATTRFFLGNDPLLIQPPAIAVHWYDFILLAIAGMVSGYATLYFLQAFRVTKETIQRKLKQIEPMWRPAIGGLLAGALLAVSKDLLETTYDPVNRAIRGEGVLLIAAATLLLKPIAAGLTIGSGGEGGTFAPVLKFGALLGFVIGTLLSFVIPEVQPGLYAVVCAAAVIAGSFYAPLSATLILFEVSDNYEVLLPLLFCTMFSILVVRKLRGDSFNPNQKSLDDEVIAEGTRDATQIIVPEGQKKTTV